MNNRISGPILLLALLTLVASIVIIMILIRQTNTTTDVLDKTSRIANELTGVNKILLDQSERDKSAPRNINDLRKGKNEFKTEYNDESVLIAEDDIKMKIPISGRLLKIMNKYTSGIQTGLVFHPTMVEGNGQNKLTYAVSLGIKDDEGNLSYQAFSKMFTKDPNQFYIHLNSDLDSGYGLIDESELCSMHELFNESVYFRTNQPSDGDSAKVGTLENHPHGAFHRGRDLYRFYEHNKSIEGKLSYLNIYHVAAGVSTKYHQPFFVWEDNNGVELIVKDAGDEVYSRMGLDVGHLCPPNCGDNNIMCNGD